MQRLRKTVFLYIERLLTKYTDRIVCISEAERMSAIQYKVAEEKELNVILNGINFASIDSAEAKTRVELGIPSDAFVVGMVGRISPQKAPDIFMQSAKLIQSRIPNAHFMIVGDGEDRSKIESYAKANHLPLYISGWTDMAYAYMKVFDVAMLLSRWEGFGLAIVEYMAAKKNFVATRIDAIPTIVRDGVDGILVNVDSPVEASDAVIMLYKDRKLAEDMKMKAWQYAHEHYDIQRVANQHIALFNELLNE